MKRTCSPTKGTRRQDDDDPEPRHDGGSGGAQDESEPARRSPAVDSPHPDDHGTHRHGSRGGGEADQPSRLEDERTREQQGHDSVESRSTSPAGSGDMRDGSMAEKRRHQDRADAHHQREHLTLCHQAAPEHEQGAIRGPVADDEHHRTQEPQGQSGHDEDQLARRMAAALAAARANGGCGQEHEHAAEEAGVRERGLARERRHTHAELRRGGQRDLEGGGPAAVREAAERGQGESRR